MKVTIVTEERRDLEKVQVLLNAIEAEVEILYNNEQNTKLTQYLTEQNRTKLIDTLYSLLLERKVTDSYQDEIWTRLLDSMSLSTEKNEKAITTENDTYESKLVKVWGWTSAQFIIIFNKLIRKILIRVNTELEAIV